MSTSAPVTDPYAAYGGKVASGAGADPYAAYGGKVAETAAPVAPAEKSLWQKAKDNFNANTQGAQPGDGAVKGFIENVGQGGGQALSALAHPLDTLSSMGHMVAHPLDQAHADVAALRADPSRFIGNAVGQVGTGAIVGGAAGEAIPKVEATISNVADKLPTRAKAGAIFNKLNTDLADQPVNLQNSAAPLQRAIEIGARGGTIPGPVSALLQRAQAIEPMTFPEARDYQASLSDLSASDKMAMNGRMKGAVAQLNHALYQDVRQAAEAGGGFGSDFDKAMTQYRQASQIHDLLDSAKNQFAKEGIKSLAKGAGIAAAGAAGYQLYKGTQ
jgi:hypothetical protein